MEVGEVDVRIVEEMYKETTADRAERERETSELKEKHLNNLEWE